MKRGEFKGSRLEIISTALQGRHGAERKALWQAQQERTAFAVVTDRVSLSCS
jgi:hypothetical protein